MWTIKQEHSVIVLGCSCVTVVFFFNYCILIVLCVVCSLQQQLSGVGVLVCAGESGTRRRFNCSYEPGEIPASHQNRRTQPQCRFTEGPSWHQPWQSLLRYRLGQNDTLNSMYNVYLGVWWLVCTELPVYTGYQFVCVHVCGSMQGASFSLFFYFIQDCTMKSSSISLHATHRGHVCNRYSN